MRIRELSVEPSALFRKLPASPRKDLNALFGENDQGYQGADANLSIEIGRGRSLWLLGDTLVGSRDDPQNIQMPRNSIAIARYDSSRKVKDVRYYWRMKKNRPVAFFPPIRPGEWVWPGAVCLIENKLFIFNHRFQTNNRVKMEGFNFQYVGLSALCVENYQEDPMDWEMEPVALPPLARFVYWANACFAGVDGFLYLWGGAYGNRPSGTHMARLPFELLNSSRKGQWEYFDGNDRVTWKQDSGKLSPLFKDRAPEMSLSYLKKHKIYLTVYGFHKSNRIGIRVAGKLEGPWSDFLEIYQPPEADWHRRYYCYAPKAHPEISNSDKELIITYATNSFRITDLYRDKRIYFPRFIALSFRE